MGAVDEIGFEMAQYGARRVLILTDPTINELGIPARIAESLTRPVGRRQDPGVAEGGSLNELGPRHRPLAQRFGTYDRAVIATAVGPAVKSPVQC